MKKQKSRRRKNCGAALLLFRGVFPLAIKIAGIIRLRERAAGGFITAESSVGLRGGVVLRETTRTDVK